MWATSSSINDLIDPTEIRTRIIQINDTRFYLLKWDPQLKKQAILLELYCKQEQMILYSRASSQPAARELQASLYPSVPPHCPRLGLLPAVTQAPLSVTFSYYIARYNPLYLCVCAHAVSIQRWGVGGQGDFTVSLRTIPLLMHLSALCSVNEHQ